MHLAREDEFERTVKWKVEARVRQGVKAVLEEVLQEEMSEHFKAGYRELTTILAKEGVTATSSATTPTCTSTPPT